MVASRLIYIIFLLSLIILFSFCGNSHFVTTENPNKEDTLNIDYIHTVIIGKQLYPKSKDLNNSKQLIDRKMLLCFESGRYRFVFYNKIKQPIFLSSIYWSEQVQNYLKKRFYIDTSETRLKKVVYTDGPYLTGFYDIKDSIILSSSDLRRFESGNENIISVKCFSTENNLINLDGIVVGNKMEKILSILDINNIFRSKDSFELVLMGATAQVNNAWYKIYPEVYSRDTNCIVLSFENKKLVRIQYFDFESTEYIFKKEKVSTKKIHY